MIPLANRPRKHTDASIPADGVRLGGAMALVPGDAHPELAHGIAALMGATLAPTFISAFADGDLSGGEANEWGSP